MSAKKQERPFDLRDSEVPVYARQPKPSVKAKVVSHSRDYLTLEFIGNEPKAFAAGEVVEISKA